ncbi:hypothetical protein CLV81_0674 [Flagellimonas meridianipacifica]|uniref:Uncharacterized protein n=1 Tax=Flagellimonas meridianipacifica TaxID=1080225 RepID=A0A2T0MGG8_9FLAO|nr:hypothetical protein CLV81_0674 [Allomuricauda pacifica]
MPMRIDLGTVDLAVSSFASRKRIHLLKKIQASRSVVKQDRNLGDDTFLL